ncbi:MAG: hypothetical protein FP825_00110 [Hyphomonas sp.]|uniref:hypothetical protein n=1 Tax=Hyphomonas sp. TaxID=87 RepID=UPI0017FE2CE2|nr:hypothetical protein [Hyphomonas sp.]MBA3066874.1 hypothetical protein [Hyphomonas sp.]MBU4060953.1 hypothetical protein [Alphaproteobacteria bacterium]MBU4166161.1 hypothetical protein [Alphaproteobacteria bacterium]
MTGLLNLDDARALLERARKHYAEFDALVRPRGGLGLWKLTEGRDPRTGEYFYQLEIDRQKLIEAKPIIADGATNIASALDHVVAAIAKANGHARSRSLYFPLGFTDDMFAKAMNKVQPFIGSEMAGVLTTVRGARRHEVPHVEAAKQISNSGKHWELMLASEAAHGIGINVPGEGQRFFDLPANAFVNASAFEYHRSTERLPQVPHSIVIGQTIGGLDESLPKSPNSIFECSFRFVEAVLSAVQGSAARVQNSSTS